MNKIYDVMEAESDRVKEQQIFFVSRELQSVEHSHKLVKSNGVWSETLFEKNVLAQSHCEVV